jgi:hypothetical protein
MRLLGILMGLFLSWGGIHARAQQPASANYALAASAFTSGIPGATNQPSSANYRLAAANLGDLSHTPLTSANFVHYPGFLAPLDSGVGRPTLHRFVYSGGRLWLYWNAVENVASYTVEHASVTPNFAPLVTGVTTNRYDLEIPVATSRFYRIKSIPDN